MEANARRLYTTLDATGLRGGSLPFTMALPYVGTGGCECEGRREQHPVFQCLGRKADGNSCMHSEGPKQWRKPCGYRLWFESKHKGRLPYGPGSVDAG